MALNLTTIEQNFRMNVRTLLQMPENSVKRANQFDPPPAGDQTTQFATVLVTQIGNMGWDEVTHKNAPYPGDPGAGEGGYGLRGENDVIESITGPRHFIASVQFFRGDALVKANSLTALLQSSNGVDGMRNAGIGIGKIGPVRNLSALVDSFFETRAQVDIEFDVISQEQVELPTFGTFGGTITPDGGPTITFEK